ncbi:MAG: metallophosphoesterase, partial [Acidobacteria bacterium]|nr:metallophosphoesterase [Acidobacteriota bacterium]
MQWQPHREPGARTRTGSRRLLATAALLALVAGRLPAKGPDASRHPSTWDWDDVSRVVAIGDLHGSHRKLVKLLIGAGLVDSDLTWSGGEDHLVITGDFIDRGVG